MNWVFAKCAVVVGENCVEGGGEVTEGGRLLEFLGPGVVDPVTSFPAALECTHSPQSAPLLSFNRAAHSGVSACTAVAEKGTRFVTQEIQV